MVQFMFVLNKEFSVSELSVMSKYELVIYGASGFTGQFVTEYVARAAEEHQLSWAVAGRSEGRLRAALAQAGATLGTDLSTGESAGCLETLTSCHSPRHLL